MGTFFILMCYSKVLYGGAEINDSREPELLPAASGTNTEKGAPPTVGGDEQPS